jgi:putative NADPH-quinone reductase
MQGVLGFGGIAPRRRTLFGMVESVSAKQRQSWLDKVRAMGREGV